MVRSFKGEGGKFGVKSFFVRWAAVLHALTGSKNTIKFTSSLLQLMSQTLIGWMVLKRLSYHQLILSLQKKKKTFTLDSMTVDQQRLNGCLPSMRCEDELDELKTCGIHVEDASPLMSEEDIFCRAIPCLAVSWRCWRFQWLQGKEDICHGLGC